MRTSKRELGDQFCEPSCAVLAKGAWERVACPYLIDIRECGSAVVTEFEVTTVVGYTGLHPSCRSKPSWE
jgi:hypothetical protein